MRYLPKGLAPDDEVACGIGSGGAKRSRLAAMAVGKAWMRARGSGQRTGSNSLGLSPGSALDLGGKLFPGSVSGSPASLADALRRDPIAASVWPVVHFEPSSSALHAGAGAGARDSV